MRGRPGGICTTVYEYDEKGRLIRESYLDEQGRLDHGSRKYAYVEYEYDASGKRTERYCKEDGSVYRQK